MLYINGIPITKEQVNHIDFDAITAAYEFMEDSDQHITFQSIPGISDAKLVSEYIEQSCNMNNEIMAHIWYYHPEFIRKIDNKWVDFIIDKYGENDEIKKHIQYEYAAKNACLVDKIGEDKYKLKNVESKYIVKYCNIFIAIINANEVVQFNQNMIINHI